MSEQRCGTCVGGVLNHLSRNDRGFNGVKWLKCNMSDELHFKGSDPGAVRHGNFINYYQFNSVENRLQLLPTDLWSLETDQSFLCLDIGCNSGVNICLVTILSRTNA